MMKSKKSNLKRRRKMEPRRKRKMNQGKRARRKKVRRRRTRTRQMSKSLCSTLLMEDSLNFTLCGRMKRKLLFLAENMKSGTGDTIIGYWQELFVTDMEGGKIFRMILDLISSMSHSRWMLEKEISLKSRTNSWPDVSSYWSR